MDWENIPYLERKKFFSVLSFLRYIFIIAISVVYLIVFYTQVIRGSYYYNLAEKNRLRMFVIHAPRGTIYDTNNEIIAENRPSITIYYYPVCEHSSKEFNTLVSVIPDVTEKIMYAVKTNRIVPLGYDINREKLFQLFSLRHRISNIFVAVEYKRKYPDGELFSHVIGYVDVISPQEYAKLKMEGYSYNDIIGKSGIEKTYDKYLRGINGALLMEVDAKGNPTKILKNLAPKPGNNVYVTINKYLQKVAHDALVRTGKNGAVVGLDPRDGAVRILVSRKDFDLNIFTDTKSLQKGKLLTDKDLPFFNRVVQGEYPPGSTFKILTTIAALNEKKLTVNTKYLCSGEFKFGDKVFRCWEKKGHGWMDLYNAIRLSCNVYFINLGLKVGIDDIEKYAKMFGFGTKTSVDLPFESNGIVPSKKWKKEKIGVSWFDGDTASVSIGQGYISVTPIQLAMFATAVANKGIIYQPYIVSKIVDTEGNVIYTHTPIKKEISGIEPQIWEFLYKAMKAVVSSGTGAAAFIPNFPIAGKTGTAQNPHGADHAWFICFGPAEENKQPELVLCVLVEHGGKGGAVAAPIAKEIFKEYIRLTYNKQVELEQHIGEKIEYGD